MPAKNELNFRNQQMQKWGFSVETWVNNGVKSGNDTDVAIRIDNNLFNQGEEPYCIWLETKDGNYCSIDEMLAQIVVTALQVNKKHKIEIPPYLGCFDNEKGAIIEKKTISTFISGENTLNLNQRASGLDNATIHSIKEEIERNGGITYCTHDLDELGKKLKEIQKQSKDLKNTIHANNFDTIYREHWLDEVGTLIDYQEGYNENFQTIKDILPYCYLADIMFDDVRKETIAETLDVVLTWKDNKYFYQDLVSDARRLIRGDIAIKDIEQYKRFWNKYKRPPKTEKDRKEIIDRVDLLVSQDLRERDGDFFTPKMWADRGIEYLNKAIGTDQNDQQSWLKDYYVWDCCCGTGNLLQDFRPEFQHKCFLSSLKRCHLRLIKSLGRLPNTPDSQIFQFDFLNDDWKPQAEGGKIPDALWKIIKETPEKLVMFINPPYAEASSKSDGGHKSKKDVAIKTKIYKRFVTTAGASMRELFAQFFLRIYNDIPNCIIGSFSSVKFLNSKDYKKFRTNFKMTIKNGFLIPSKTFDNVKGSFPISFCVIDTENKNIFNNYNFGVFNDKNEYKGKKNINTQNDKNDIVSWIRNFDFHNDTNKKDIGFLRMAGTDMQTQTQIWISSSLSSNDIKKKLFRKITNKNIKETLIYQSVRHSIKKTWLNNQDKFLSPYKKEQDNLNTMNIVGVEHYLYEDDQDFINNCIVYAIFTKNYTDWNLFDNGELNLQNANRDLEVWWLLKAELNKGLTQQAQDVYNSALAICRFYHQNKCGKNYEHNGKIITDYQYKVNASWNDILNGVKGVKLDKNGKAKRNNGCEAYTEAEVLFTKLREDLKLLAKEVEKGVYKYGFLRG